MLVRGVKLTDYSCYCRSSAAVVKGVCIFRTPLWMGGGVAPPIEGPPRVSMVVFSRRPSDGEVFFLLGQDVRKSLMSRGGGPWSDFGGQLEVGESLEEAAAREFREETMWCVDSGGEGGSKGLSTQLERGHYTKKVQTRAQKGDGTCFSCTCFLREIPWQPSCRGKFRFVRRCIFDAFTQQSSSILKQHGLDSHPALESTGEFGGVSVNLSSLEKTDLCYWSLRKLVRALSRKGNRRLGEGAFLRRCDSHLLRLCTRELRWL